MYISNDRILFLLKAISSHSLSLSPSHTPAYKWIRGEIHCDLIVMWEHKLDFVCMKSHQHLIWLLCLKWSLCELVAQMDAYEWMRTNLTSEQAKRMNECVWINVEYVTRKASSEITYRTETQVVAKGSYGNEKSDHHSTGKWCFIYGIYYRWNLKVVVYEELWSVWNAFSPLPFWCMCMCETLKSHQARNVPVDIFGWFHMNTRHSSTWMWSFRWMKQPQKQKNASTECVAEI